MHAEEGRSERRFVALSQSRSIDPVSSSLPTTSHRSSTCPSPAQRSDRFCSVKDLVAALAEQKRAHPCLALRHSPFWYVFVLVAGTPAPIRGIVITLVYGCLNRLTLPAEPPVLSVNAQDLTKPYPRGNSFDGSLIVPASMMILTFAAALCTRVE